MRTFSSIRQRISRFLQPFAGAIDRLPSSKRRITRQHGQQVRQPVRHLQASRLGKHRCQLAIVIHPP